MNDSSRKPTQKPVFIIEPFDASNIEHIKGNVRITLNKRFATDLCKLISECEFSEEEGYMLAMRGNLQRWYKQRYEENKIRKGEEDLREGKVSSHEDVRKELNLDNDPD